MSRWAFIGCGCTCPERLIPEAFREIDSHLSVSLASWTRNETVPIATYANDVAVSPLRSSSRSLTQLVPIATSANNVAVSVTLVECERFPETPIVSAQAIEPNIKSIDTLESTENRSSWPFDVMPLTPLETIHPFALDIRHEIIPMGTVSQTPFLTQVDTPPPSSGDGIVGPTTIRSVLPEAFAGNEFICITSMKPYSFLSVDVSCMWKHVFPEVPIWDAMKFRKDSGS